MQMRLFWGSSNFSLSYPDEIEGPWLLSLDIDDNELRREYNWDTSTFSHSVRLIISVSVKEHPKDKPDSPGFTRVTKFTRDCDGTDANLLAVVHQTLLNTNLSLPSFDEIKSLVKQARKASLQEYVLRACLDMMDLGLSASECAEITTKLICEEVMSS